MNIIEEKIYSGVHRKDIIEYFVTISNSFDSEGIFIGYDWEVEVGEQEHSRLGSINLSVTVIKFRAEEQRCNEIMTKFRTKFLSAGG